MRGSLGLTSPPHSGQAFGLGRARRQADSESASSGHLRWPARRANGSNARPRPSPSIAPQSARQILRLPAGSNPVFRLTSGARNCRCAVEPPKNRMSTPDSITIEHRNAMEIEDRANGSCERGAVPNQTAAAWRPGAILAAHLAAPEPWLLARPPTPRIFDYPRLPTVRGRPCQVLDDARPTRRSVSDPWECPSWPSWSACVPMRPGKCTRRRRVWCRAVQHK